MKSADGRDGKGECDNSEVTAPTQSGLSSQALQENLSFAVFVESCSSDGKEASAADRCLITHTAAKSHRPRE